MRITSPLECCGMETSFTSLKLFTLRPTSTATSWGIYDWSLPPTPMASCFTTTLCLIRNLQPTNVYYAPFVTSVTHTQQRHSPLHKKPLSSVPVVSRWLWRGNCTTLEVISMVVKWWIVAFLRSGQQWKQSPGALISLLLPKLPKLPGPFE